MLHSRTLNIQAPSCPHTPHHPIPPPSPASPHHSTPMSATDNARGAALHRTYAQLLWKRERVQSRDLNRKLKLKWAAIAALPTPELKRAALVVLPFVPLRLRLAGISPPLKGFHLPSAASSAAAAAEAAAAAAAAAAGSDSGRRGRVVSNAGTTSTLAALAAARRKAGGSGGPNLLSSAMMRGGGGGGGGIPTSGAPASSTPGTPVAPASGKGR